MTPRLRFCNRGNSQNSPRLLETHRARSILRGNVESGGDGGLTRQRERQHDFGAGARIELAPGAAIRIFSCGLQQPATCRISLEGSIRLTTNTGCFTQSGLAPLHAALHLDLPTALAKGELSREGKGLAMAPSSVSVVTNRLGLNRLR